jgi:hypothetical protein
MLSVSFTAGKKDLFTRCSQVICYWMVNNNNVVVVFVKDKHV